MRAKPFPYQKEGVRDIEDFITRNGGALLADDMGLGKTLQALWFLRRERVPTFPALVICPASVKHTWEHEARAHVKIHAQVLEGETPPTKHIAPTKLLIINPHILHYWLPTLKQTGIQTLVMDECQMFQNPKTKRTQAAIELAHNIPNKLALSGTPLTNRPSELWPTLHILRPDLFPSFAAYAHRYCEPKRTPWGWQFKGATNIPQLHALLKRTCMIRRLKTDVLGELPRKVRRVVPMDLTNRDEYNHASTDFINWMQKNYQGSKAKRAKRAIAVTRVGYLLRLIAKLKCRAVVQWANEFLAEYPNEKLVLFAIHKKMIDVLRRRIHANSVVVDGSVTGRFRKRAVDQFRQDPNTRLFIGNIKAAGIGTDGLQDACSNLAFAEIYWRPSDHIQAEDRIHRIGQEDVAWINYLIADGTTEEKLCRIIQEKQTIIRGVLDGETIDGDLDVFDQLIRTVENDIH